MTSHSYRVEHDSMGALDVPATALWGAQTQRAIQNFPASGLRMPRAFIRAMGLIKRAAAAANADLGDLPPSRRRRHPGRGARGGAGPLRRSISAWTYFRPVRARAAT